MNAPKGDTKEALYFGFGSHGHLLRNVWGTVYKARVSYPGFPWEDGFLDGQLLRNRKVVDAPDGRVHWVCGGRPVLWFAFVWWDRSDDKRGASNSGFYVRGFGPDVVTRSTVEAAADDALKYACDAWPEVVVRQAHSLVLQELPG